mgnify:CR=1 FL=1
MQMNSNAHYWYQEQGGKRTSYTSNRSDVESYELTLRQKTFIPTDVGG